MLERIRGLMFVLKPVIDPFRPALSRALFTLLGIIIGIFLVYTGGFGLVDVEWRDAEPVHLQESWREQWVKNAALAHQYYLEHGVDPQSANESITEDLEGAGYDSAKVQELAENEGNQAVSTALLQVAELPDNKVAEAKAEQVSTSFWDTIGPCLCVFFWLLILIFVGIALSFKPIPIGKWKKGPIARDERTEGIADAERNRRLAAKEAQELAAAAAAQAAVDYGKPEANFTSTYVLGDDHFSYSYPIEPGGGFAGEVGIEIGKTLGDGPKKVTAFDVFIFDQKDIQTLTYLIVSEHAYVDDTLRAQLAPRAEEMIVPQQGESFVMETRNLRMKVQVLQMEYGEGSLPPNSFFGKLIVQLTVWLKEGGSDAGGDSLSAMPPLPRPVMDMPPMPPAPMTEQRPPMATPLAPPPMQPPMGQPGGGFAPPPPQPLTSNQPMQPPMPPQPSSDPFGGQQPPLPPQRQPGPGAGSPPPPPPRAPMGGQQPGMSAPPPPPRPAPSGQGVPPPPPPRPGGQPMQPGQMPPPPPPRPQGQQPGVPPPPPPPLGRQSGEQPPDLDDPFGDTTTM